VAAAATAAAAHHLDAEHSWEAGYGLHHVEEAVGMGEAKGGGRSARAVRGHWTRPRVQNFNRKSKKMTTQLRG
jgi:hypothetical protein